MEIGQRVLISRSRRKVRGMIANRDGNNLPIGKAKCQGDASFHIGKEKVLIRWRGRWVLRFATVFFLRAAPGLGLSYLLAFRKPGDLAIAYEKHRWPDLDFCRA